MSHIFFVVLLKFCKKTQNINLYYFTETPSMTFFIFSMKRDFINLQINV